MSGSDWFADTDDKAFAALVEIHRRMNPGDKLAHALELSEMLMEMARTDVRRLHPEADEREVFLRATARHLDRQTMIRVYGWDPESGEKP